MKRLLLVAMAAVLAATSLSCIREEDREIFRHPVHLQGSISPNFGVPIGFGEMTLNDLFTSLDDTYTGLIVPDEDILTIYYEANLSDTLLVDYYISKQGRGAKHGTPQPKDAFGEDETSIWADTVMRFYVDIDMFSKVDLDAMAEHDLSIGHLWLNLASSFNSDSPEAHRQDIQEHASLEFNDLSIEYTDRVGQTHTFEGFQFQPISFLDLLAGGELRFDDVDLAEIINAMPSRITSVQHMRLYINKDYFHNMDVPHVTSFRELADTLHLTWMSFNADLSVRFPMMIHIGDLPFHYTINFGNALEQVDLQTILEKIDENIEVGLEESSLNLVVENGLPISLAVKGTLVDENGDLLSCIIPLDTIKAAPTAPLPSGNGDHEAVGTTKGKISAVLDYDKLADLNRSKGLRFDLGIATGDGHAAIKKSDMLGLKVYLKVHPTVSVDIPLIGGGNNGDDNDNEE